MKMSGNHFVLMDALLSLGNEATGAELSAATGIGRESIYVHLGRMAEKEWVEPEEKLGPSGHALTYYKVNGLGQSAMIYETERRRVQQRGRDATGGPVGVGQIPGRLADGRP